MLEIIFNILQVMPECISICNFQCIYRKLPCDKLDNFSPQLVANSLAFMNCATGSEEQRELEALERLAARAAVLERSRPLPAGELDD